MKPTNLRPQEEAMRCLCRLVCPTAAIGVTKRIPKKK